MDLKYLAGGSLDIKMNRVSKSEVNQKWGEAYH